MGSLLPFFPVYLKQRGLGLAQVGYVGASASVAVLITPVLATLLADRFVSGRRLLGAVFAISGCALIALYHATAFWPILILFSLYSLTFAAMTALQDGLNFLTQHHHRSQGRPTTAYHHVRVWGTVGFMVPSLIVFELLGQGYPLRLIMACAVAFCALGLLNSFALPNLFVGHAAPPQDTLDHQPASVPKVHQLPTLAALRIMREPHVLVFCIAMFLSHMAVAAYYTFYPIYLKESVGLDPRWLGLVANLGVAIEIFFMLGFGLMLTRWGLKRLMVIGVICMLVRLGLLASSEGIWVAVGTQAFHGIMVLVVHVTPPIFLDRHADNTYRNSVQGVYVMAVYGVGRIVGNLVAGHIAQVSLPAVFFYAAVLCGLAAGLFAFAFHDRSKPQDAVLSSATSRDCKGAGLSGK